MSVLGLLAGYITSALTPYVTSGKREFLDADAPPPKKKKMHTRKMLYVVVLTNCLWFHVKQSSVLEICCLAF